MTRLSVLYQFEIHERLGRFLYRGVRAKDGSLRVEKMGVRTGKNEGSWQPILKDLDEAGMVRHWSVMTKNVGIPVTKVPPGWIAERIRSTIRH